MAENGKATPPHFLRLLKINTNHDFIKSLQISSKVNDSSNIIVKKTSICTRGISDLFIKGTHSLLLKCFVYLGNIQI